MWSQFLTPLQFQEREIELLVDLSEGFSGSDIHEVCLRLQRRRIASQKDPELKDAFQVLQNMAIGEGTNAVSWRDSAARTSTLYQPCFANGTPSYTAIRQLRICSACRRRRLSGGRREWHKMAERIPAPQQDRLPIKLIMPKQGAERKIPPGGTPPKPFRTVDTKYRSHLSNQVSALRSAIVPQVRRTGSAPIRVKLLAKAAAKSHRPEYLFSPQSCPIIGVGSLGGTIRQGDTGGT